MNLDSFTKQDFYTPPKIVSGIIFSNGSVTSEKEHFVCIFGARIAPHYNPFKITQFGKKLGEKFMSVECYLALYPMLTPAKELPLILLM